MRLSELSLAQRLLAGLGCVVVLIALGVAGLLTVWQLRANLMMEREQREAPAGWADSLRAYGRIPDLGDLVPAATDSGDGAWAVYDTARAWRVVGVERAYRALIGAMPADAADSALWRRIATDTALDAFAGAARSVSWHATDRVLTSAPAAARRNVMLLPEPKYSPVRDAARALVVRGLMRLERGDRAGARADLAAATGLGSQMLRHEPGYLGFLVGRATLASGLHGWSVYATKTRDSTLGAQVEGFRSQFGGRPGATSGLLMVETDTAISIARDSSLAPGLRLFAVWQMLSASALRPTGLLFGPPRRARACIRELAHDPDRDIARLAEIADRTAGRMNAFGFPGLVREAGNR
jgi:hypothetical protein